ncbi:hypothetical protein [Rhizobium sp. BK251]|uniref:hypothetical protein n=1 Tax=Rhizobium sp. BK251 TaxID=2512125 RepID=UPI00104A1B67|nr:hypothetical protein [Rhizobium sp. BK251]TCL63713.1 hypothetical protein EV286_116111 [Rhizobium sp. BK251]
MDVFLHLELCEPAPCLFGENGHLGVTDGTSAWVVVITQEAMKATAGPVEASLKRLVRYADLYRDMAEAIIARAQDQDGKIWIFERDVIARRAQGVSRDAGAGKAMAVRPLS